MKKITASILMSIYALSSNAIITNVVDVAALAECGTGMVNGWTVNGIDSYTDRVSFRLNNRDEFLISPEYDAPITEIVLKAKSSSQAGRRMTVFPYLAGNFVYDPRLSCDYSPNKDTYVPMSVRIEGAQAVTRFKIAFDDPDDGSTGWGVSELSVVTGDPILPPGPQHVSVENVTTAKATISWDRNDSAPSNLVTVSVITKHEELSSILCEHDFLLCANSGDGDTQDRSADLAAKYPEFTGERIYYPAASVGVLRISTGSANGRLTHAGCPDYSGISLEITAKRYPNDVKCTRLYAYYLSADAEPVEIGSMEISDDYTTGRIPLDGTPGGVSINIGNLDGYKSNRRYLVDRIAFIRDTPLTVTTTNAVTSSVVCGTNRLRVDGLSRLTEYAVSVHAIDAAGRMSEPSAPVAFKTAERDAGTMVIFR